MSLSKTFIRRLVLIQPMKTRPDMTEKLVNGSLGRKESNRTKMMYISILRIEYITYILGQKRNAAYKTCIVYGGLYTHLSQTIRQRLSADSWIMSSWGCASYHCHRTKFRGYNLRHSVGVVNT